MNHTTPGLLLLIALLTLPGQALAQANSQRERQPEAVKAPTSNSHYQRKEFTAADGSTLSYWLMSPATIEPGEKYPLVLALHGRGGNTEAAGVLGSDAMRKQYPCFVLAPAVSRAQTWAVPKDFRRLPGSQRLPVAIEALSALLKEQPIDAERVYVTGQSMGGFGSFGAVAHRPQLFAAAMPVCGGWDPADAEKMKGTPLWIFHGGADKTVPVDRSQTMEAAIKQAGGEPKYTEYPGVGHNSWSRTYADPAVWAWLFAQRRQQP